MINPKNLVLTLAVILALGEAGVPAGQAVLGLSVYIGLGSLTIAVPVLYRVGAGAQADANLAEVKQWLQARSTTVIAVVFLLLGALLLGKGLIQAGLNSPMVLVLRAACSVSPRSTKHVTRSHRLTRAHVY